jgi:CHASE3 domain sensor protein
MGHWKTFCPTLKDAESGQRGYLLTGNPEHLRPHNDALAGINDKLKHLKKLIGNAAQQERVTLEAVRLAWSQYRICNEQRDRSCRHAFSTTRLGQPRWSS